MSISMKWSLVSHESLDPNSEKIDGFYKGDNFINDIAFGASLFCFLWFKYIFPILIAVNFSQSPVIVFKSLKWQNITSKIFNFTWKWKLLRFFKCSTDDNISKSLIVCR